MVKRSTQISAGWRGKAWTLALAAVLWFGMTGGVLANEELLNLQEDPAQWVMPNQNYAGWNYSPLDEINTENVQDLRVVWTFPTGITDSHEAQPLVIGDTMYIVTPKPNHIYALDLTQDGLIKWEFRPDWEEDLLERATSAACCGAQTRGMAYAEGKIIFNTLDGRLYALDAEDGEVLWVTQTPADVDINEATTTHPLIVRDNVIIGNEGGESGVRGWVSGYDLNTGELKWHYYNMGPNDEMGVGPRWNPFYEVDSQWENPGLDTWYGDSWERGGGTVWGFFTYDPDLNLFYYGTGNCAPWNPDYRRPPSDERGLEGAFLDQYANNYCASLMARDPDTGELIWAYSLVPQDMWDIDEPGQNILVDLEINGEMRQTLIRAARNGFFYVFDRATGELIHEPVMHTGVNWADSIDPTTGMPNFNPEKITYTDEPVEYVCPWISTVNWENQAYSPQTGLVYFAPENRCRDMVMIEGEYVPGETWTLNQGEGPVVRGPDGEHFGAIQAWDPVANQEVWRVTWEAQANRKPLTVTAGNLVFQGSDEGLFRAFDATSGEILWSFRTGTDFRNAPISYLGPDGRQYIAVISSRAATDPAVTPDAPPDDTARLRRTGTILYVFGLP